MSSKARAVRRVASRPVRYLVERPLPSPAAVRHLRARLGLTQEEYARMLGVTWTTVSRWERGQARPDARGLAKLARLQELLDLIGDAIRPQDVPRFLSTPHAELRGYPPIELLDNDFGFEALKSLVVAAQSGAYR